jgi:helicase
MIAAEGKRAPSCARAAAFRQGSAYPSFVCILDAKARSVLSTEARLAQLAGNGRIIFTASAATEPAYEHRRFGHGFLTHFLLEALRGAEEVASGGKLSLYRLLEHATSRVKAAALQIGRPQNPTMRGSTDGDVIWPVFVPGTKFAAASLRVRPQT